MGIALTTHFELVDSNCIAQVSAKNKLLAKSALQVAKDMEANQIKEGYHYVWLNPKTRVLRKIN